MVDSAMRLMPLGEVARSLGISVVSVRRLEVRGDLRSVRIGARVMIPASEVARVQSEGAGTPRRRNRGQGQSTAAISREMEAR